MSTSWWGGTVYGVFLDVELIEALCSKTEPCTEIVDTFNRYTGLKDGTEEKHTPAKLVLMVDNHKFETELTRYPDWFPIQEGVEMLTGFDVNKTHAEGEEPHFYIGVDLSDKTHEEALKLMIEVNQKAEMLERISGQKLMIHSVLYNDN